MKQPVTPTNISRRNVLRTSAVLAGLGGSGLVGSAAASQGNLVSQIQSNGRWAAYPDNPALWQRSKNFLDFSQSDLEQRWMAKPASGGSVRCRVENDGDIGIANAGFYLNVGEIGPIESFTIDAQTVESALEDAIIVFGYYFDTEGNGDYFDWERTHGNTDSFVTLGDDPECLHGLPADEGLTVGSDFEFGDLIIPIGMIPEEADENDYLSFPPLGFAITPYTATLDDFKSGEVEGDGYVIDLHTDEATEAALQVSVAGLGTDTVEEVIIDDVTVNRD